MEEFLEIGGIGKFWRNRRMGILHIVGSNDHSNIAPTLHIRYAIIFLTGTDRPSLADLHNHVIPIYAHHWKKLLATLAYHYLLYKALSTAFQTVLPGAVKTCLRHGLNRI